MLSRQFTNFPPVHQARLTKHYKTQVGQKKNFGEKNVLGSVRLLFPCPCPCSFLYLLFLPPCSYRDQLEHYPHHRQLPELSRGDYRHHCPYYHRLNNLVSSSRISIISFCSSFTRSSRCSRTGRPTLDWPHLSRPHPPHGGSQCSGGFRGGDSVTPYFPSSSLPPPSSSSLNPRPYPYVFAPRYFITFDHLHHHHSEHFYHHHQHFYYTHNHHDHPVNITPQLGLEQRVGLEQ